MTQTEPLSLPLTFDLAKNLKIIRIVLMMDSVVLSAAAYYLLSVRSPAPDANLIIGVPVALFLASWAGIFILSRTQKFGTVQINGATVSFTPETFFGIPSALQQQEVLLAEYKAVVLKKSVVQKSTFYQPFIQHGLNPELSFACGNATTRTSAITRAQNVAQLIRLPFNEIDS